MTRKRDQTIKSQNTINILERAKPGNMYMTKMFSNDS